MVLDLGRPQHGGLELMNGMWRADRKYITGAMVRTQGLDIEVREEGLR